MYFSCFVRYCQTFYPPLESHSHKLATKSLCSSQKLYTVFFCKIVRIPLIFSIWLPAPYHFVLFNFFISLNEEVLLLLPIRKRELALYFLKQFSEKKMKIKINFKNSVA